MLTRALLLLASAAVAVACGAHERPRASKHVSFAIYGFETDVADTFAPRAKPKLGVTQPEIRASNFAWCNRVCPGVAPRTLLIFRAAPAIGLRDLERGKTRLREHPATGSPFVLIRFTREGQRKFEDLTRKLANHGRNRGHPDHFVIVLDHRVLAAPQIDYKMLPKGLTGAREINLYGIGSASAADRLVRRLRGH